MLFAYHTDIEKEFSVRLLTSDEMDAALLTWDAISKGRPSWLNAEEHIGTINMAKHIADTRARLIALDIGLTVSNDDDRATPSPRVKKLQEIADDLLTRLPEKLGDAERLGGIMLKWNGQGWDYILPGDFGVTAQNNSGGVTGAIFASYAEQGLEHFVRLEYHRFEGDVYRVTNRAYKLLQLSSVRSALGGRVPLNSIPVWQDLQEEVEIQQLLVPLFSYYRVPGANIVDPATPLGMSVFANAVEELRAVDIAFSRKGEEVEDSRHVTFVGQNLIQYAQNKNVKLPRFVRMLGTGFNRAGDETSLKEHVPTLLTEDRIKDINFNLSLAGVKCGFSEGVFVLDGQTGMMTATQVEADDRDTIQTIKADRDALKTAVLQAMAGADAMLSLYGLVPPDTWQLNFHFGDITYNYEEDKASWRLYAAQGWVPKWKYLVKFEGMSEQEAKALIAEAAAENAKPEGDLFGAEE